MLQLDECFRLQFFGGFYNYSFTEIVENEQFQSTIGCTNSERDTDTNTSSTSLWLSLLPTITFHRIWNSFTNTHTKKLHLKSTAVSKTVIHHIFSVVTNFSKAKIKSATSIIPFWSLNVYFENVRHLAVVEKYAITPKQNWKHETSEKQFARNKQSGSEDTCNSQYAYPGHSIITLRKKNPWI